MKNKKSNISEIFVIVHQSLNNYTFDRFGLNQNLNHKITYLNILPLISKRLHEKYKKDDFKKENFLNFYSNLSLFKFLINTPKNSFYTNLTGKNFYSIFINILLKFKNFTKFEIVQPSLPLLELKYSKLSSLIRNQKFLLKKINSKIQNVIINNLYNFTSKKAKIIFISNDQNIKKIKHNGEVFKINHLDYFNYKKVSHKNNSGNYFCFIDQEQENSFENQLYHVPYIPNYLQRISEILKNIESKTGAKAKVALHHRRNTIPSELKCFECIKDNTISLIKDSKFVLTHNSTAVNFAILFKKPITLIWLKEFETRLSKYAQMKKLKNEINCDILDENQEISNYNFVKNIDDQKYESFIKEYIYFNEKIPFEHPWVTIDKKLLKI